MGPFKENHSGPEGDNTEVCDMLCWSLYVSKPCYYCYAGSPQSPQESQGTQQPINQDKFIPEEINSIHSANI